MPKQRIDKIIASTGKYSRSEVKQLIKNRKVTASGQMVLKPEEKFDPDTDEICVNGETLHFQKYTYLMLHKPAGVVSATEDRSEKTVLDLLPAEYFTQGVSPVGRLDKDTDGLLLLTNDGQCVHNLLSPKKHVDKVYFTRVAGELTPEDTDAFQNGITLGDGTVCRSAVLKILSSGPISEAEVTIQEGKYHQVKRMFAARGKKVCYLKRLSMGPLLLDPSLAPGEYRPLTADEIKMITGMVENIKKIQYPKEKNKGE